ncbi:MAG TPA: sigma-70 family RNA polymerase sigma factor [Rummeliibacillus sp.]|nr:sigma-70 family RNA polymerase sigma factor [Rummeliibacillus sp.]
MTCSTKNFIVRLKKQKEDALEFVIDAYMPLVKAIAYKILQPLAKRDAVDECVNDVFLSVWQNAKQFSGDQEDFKKWIGMIAKYKAIDLYRILEKQRSREEQLEMEKSYTDKKDLQQQLLQREQKNELLFALSKLDILDRDIFVMKFFLEMKNSEIAEKLNITKAAVDNRLYRGKRKLANTIQLRESFI